MARIKIEDLPVLEAMQEEELKGVLGGLLTPAAQSSTRLVSNSFFDVFTHIEDENHVFDRSYNLTGAQTRFIP